jgi:hypothetical protein
MARARARQQQKQQASQVLGQTDMTLALASANRLTKNVGVHAVIVAKWNSATNTRGG